MLMACVLYFLSTGPVALYRWQTMDERTIGTPENPWVLTFYAPMRFAHTHSRIAKRMIDGYVSLWFPNHEKPRLGFRDAEKTE